MNIYGITDKGKIRIINEDNLFVHIDEDKKFAFAAVCDGMGGANGGEVASELAIETVEENINCITSYPRRSQWGKLLRRIVNDSNKKIYEKSREDISLFGMGTTFVAFFCSTSKATIANIGDSRAYLISEDEIKQITKDHSLVNELVKKGELSANEASKHPNKNVITRALGVDSKVQCDIFDINVCKGQYILLCSDGLTEEVSEPEIHFEVMNHNSAEESCNSLIELANSRGGHDNISVVICAF